ncbi:hypothetical protein SM124_15175 [Bacillus sp. 31A1R]|uniref:Uncharacterized protein n=1 Tax=Robertmurraya mangrovi TaxID=3098077 RepID=A0ABU5J0X3_9BACI|nr:hypothetical protein [Bacillus sp. 31A1R]MDZ5473059.1 hypothetical protein [Bacillus sp. 31A1R]
MLIVWGIVMVCVAGLLVFGKYLDSKTDRYRQMSDKKVKEEIESVKDRTSKESYPTNINNHGPF